MSTTEQIKSMHASGMKNADIARAIGCTPANVAFHLKKKTATNLFDEIPTLTRNALLRHGITDMEGVVAAIKDGSIGQVHTLGFSGMAAIKRVLGIA